MLPSIDELNLPDTLKKLTAYKDGLVLVTGPTGSGKSTTLGIILGTRRASSGSFSWFEKGSSHLLRRNIGALLEKPNFYPHLNAVQNLRITATIKP